MGYSPKSYEPTAWTSNEDPLRQPGPKSTLRRQKERRVSNKEISYLRSAASPRVQKAARFPSQRPIYSSLGNQRGAIKPTFDFKQDATTDSIPQAFSFTEALECAETAEMVRQQSSDSIFEAEFDLSSQMSLDETFLLNQESAMPELLSSSFPGGLPLDLGEKPEGPFVEDETFDPYSFLGSELENGNTTSVQMHDSCSVECYLGESFVAPKPTMSHDSIMANLPGSTTLSAEHLEDDGESDCQAGYDDSSNTKQSQGGRIFACPYYRLDPIRHIHCISRKLNRIKDLKQHLTRRHKDEVSTGAKGSLKTRVDRELPPEEQWRAICKILFETSDLKGSPYLHSTEEEVIGIALSIFQNKSNEAISRVLQNKGLPVLQDENIQQLITGLLKDSKCFSKQHGQESDSGGSTKNEVDSDSKEKTLEINPEPGSESSASSTIDRDEEHEPVAAMSRSLTPDVGMSYSFEDNTSESGQEQDSSPLINDAATALVEKDLLTEISRPHEAPAQSHSIGSCYNVDDVLMISNQPGLPQGVHDTAAIDQSLEISASKGLSTSTMKHIWTCCGCSYDNTFSSGRACQFWPCGHHFNPVCCAHYEFSAGSELDLVPGESIGL